MPRIEITDQSMHGTRTMSDPDMPRTAVKLDGEDITRALRSYRIERTGSSDPEVTFTIHGAIVRAGLEVDEAGQTVTDDFPETLVNLLHMAGWYKRDQPRTASPETAALNDDVRRAAIDHMQQEVYECNVAHGWFDAARVLGDDIALLHSEVSEAYEAYRKGSMEEYAYDTDSSVPGQPEYDPSSFPAELADIFIRLLDTCERSGVDLFAAFEHKLGYNQRRPYRHGNKVV